MRHICPVTHSNEELALCEKIFGHDRGERAARGK